MLTMFKEIDILAIKIIKYNFIYFASHKLLLSRKCLCAMLSRLFLLRGSKMLFGILITSLIITILEHLSRHLVNTCYVFFSLRFKVTEAFGYFMKPL